MQTFNESYSELQSITGDESAATLVLFKRWLNTGLHKFQNNLNRYIVRTSETANVVADQQYYQMPEACVRLTGVTVTVSSIPYPLVEVPNESRWRYLNTDTSTASIPEYFFVRGQDEFGIFPKPPSNITTGMEIHYETREKDMTQADFITGTVTVTNGDATITHSATGFTAQMVGRFFKVTDGSDGIWYKIASFTDTSNMELENIYEGTTGAAKAFQIGEIPKNIPEEYHESLIDFAMYRFYLKRKDRGSANDYKALFEAAIEECKDNYASKTTSKVIHRHPVNRLNTGFKQIPRNIS